MDELEFFSKVIRLVDCISDKGLSNMLITTEEVINHLTKTKHYKAIEEDLRNGTLQFHKLEDITKGLDLNPRHDINLVVWLLGFRLAAGANDSQHMLFQLSLYVAAQRLSIYRIQNDKIRLILTYIHIEALQSLI